MRHVASFLVVSFISLGVRPALAETYPTQYYNIHTDLSRSDVREAALRISKMAEEYQSRTRGFAGKITTKLPFYLFSNPADYFAAGGLANSAGVYTGDKLMAIAGKPTSGDTWRLVQHEGFHQFLHAVIGGDIPVWLNEGMAEYFGEAIFTGDGFVTGVIPNYRLGRIQQAMRAGAFVAIPQIMVTERGQWNHEMKTANYDQAWSMVHFLVHAESGKYRKSLDGFLREVSRKGLSWEIAWRKNFGSGVGDFEKLWRSYWLGLQENPTSDMYAQATVATMTSFLARAYAGKQTFRSADEFFAAAKGKTLKMSSNDWLPPALLERALKNAPQLGKWSLEPKGRGSAAFSCTLNAGSKLTGTFVVKKGRVHRVNVELSSAK